MSGTITAVMTYVGASEPGLTCGTGYIVAESGHGGKMVGIINDFGHYMTVPRNLFAAKSQGDK